MTRTLYIISDLHLGGAPPTDTDPGFQMCPPKSRRALVALFEHIRAAHAAGDAVELVINGDFVDFLAEEDLPDYEPDDWEGQRFSAFTTDDAHAAAKLARIFERVDGGLDPDAQAFAALKRLVMSGAAVTVLLGNHDLELCSPSARRVLVHALTDGAPARLELIFDGQALRRGDLVIEHGNQYDGWNHVDHDALRRWRSAITRRMTHDPMAPVGSQLVARVMNDLKRRFRFLDLAKPEFEVAVPLLVAIEPSTLAVLRKLVGLRKQARNKERAIARGVLKPIAASADEERPSQVDLNAVATASNANAARLDPIAAYAASMGRVVIECGKIAVLDVSSRALGLREAWLKFRDTLPNATDMLEEDEPYLLGASDLLDGSTGTVVFGHTHLAKRRELSPGCWYLNAGTWCPIITIPKRFWEPTDPSTPAEETRILKEIATFMEDMRDNRFDGWEQLHATFAKVVMDGDAVRTREIWRVDAAGDLARFEGYPEPPGKPASSEEDSDASNRQ